MSDTDLQIKLDDLKNKRSELLERLAAIEKDYRRGLDADAEERAIQLENREVLAGIEKSTREELARIEKLIVELEKQPG